MKAQVFHTDLLPQPAPNLTREVALRWLGEDLPELLYSIAYAVAPVDPRAELDRNTREGVHVLLGDLAELARACVAAVKGQRAHIEPAAGASEWTENLARVVVKGLNGDDAAAASDGFEYLGRVLLERLERRDGAEGRG